MSFPHNHEHEQAVRTVLTVSEDTVQSLLHGACVEVAFPCQYEEGQRCAVLIGTSDLHADDEEDRFLDGVSDPDAVVEIVKTFKVDLEKPDHVALLARVHGIPEDRVLAYADVLGELNYAKMELVPGSYRPKNGAGNTANTPKVH